MTDAFAAHAIKLESPPSWGVTITPADDTDLVDGLGNLYVTRALNVKHATNTYATVRVLLADNIVPIDLYIAVGFAFPCRVRQVFSTGTDANLTIVGLY